MKNVDYSIIVPVYFNEGSLKTTFGLIKEHVFNKNPQLTHEIIFVDDGSGDNSLKELLEIKAECPDKVTVIKLARNFGQPSARLAGYEQAKGKCAIHVSADLQDPPELMNEMLRYHFEEDYDIVIAVRTNRNDGFLTAATSKFFYGLIQKLCFKNMPIGGFDYHLISKRERYHY